MKKVEQHRVLGPCLEPGLGRNPAWNLIGREDYMKAAHPSSIEVIGAGLGRTGTKSLQVRVLRLVGCGACRTTCK